MTKSTKDTNKKGKALFAIAIAAVFLLILSLSIALPIYIRPFFYAHVSAMNLPEQTGWTYAEIVQAYNEMINFCTLFTPFSTGVMKWSEEGKAHFADVRALFVLDAAILIICAVYLIVITVLNKKGKIRLARFCGHGASFYGAIIAVVVPVVIGSLAAIDFDRAFEVFHAIFFPGKTNWMFNPNTDEIIQVMPEEFFRNCAILIGVSVVSISAVLIGRDCARKSRERRAAAMEENNASGTEAVEFSGEAYDDASQAGDGHAVQDIIAENTLSDESVDKKTVNGEHIFAKDSRVQKTNTDGETDHESEE